MKVTFKTYWDVGTEQLLKELVHSSTANSVKEVRYNKHKHEILLQVWEALYQWQVHQFLVWRKFMDAEMFLCSHISSSHVTQVITDYLSNIWNSGNIYSDFQSFLKVEALIDLKLDG